MNETSLSEHILPVPWTTDKQATKSSVIVQNMEARIFSTTLKMCVARFLKFVSFPLKIS